MKLLLTSGGVTAPAIRTALDDLLPRPVAECAALVVPTAQWGHPMCTPESAWRAVSGQPLGGPVAPMSDLGWGSLGLLELTALPHVDPDRWHGWLDAADALLVDGGDALFLAHWLRASGLWDALADRRDLVWVGVSAGSMVLTPRVGPEFVQWRDPERPADDDRTLGLVDFAIFPHLDHPEMPENTLAEAERWAAGIDVPAYALDERSAVRVVDGEVEVVSDGQWHRFDVEPDEAAPSARTVVVRGHEFRVRPSEDGVGAHVDWVSGPNADYGFSMGKPVVFTPEGQQPPPSEDGVPEWLLVRSIEDFLDGIDPQTGYLRD